MSPLVHSRSRTTKLPGSPVTSCVEPLMTIFIPAVAQCGHRSAILNRRGEGVVSLSRTVSSSGKPVSCRNVKPCSRHWSSEAM